MEALIMTAQLLLGLSILVGVHELGHMLTAKYFGMRVEKFSIGFPPKVFGFTKGETEYSLGAIPLGGFVKISGMIDESLDTANLSKEPEPYEFRAKPAWQRLIVMMGGIIVNVITGILIFVLMIFFLGEEFVTKDEVNKRGIVAYPLAQKIGLQTGDKIVKVNGQNFQKFSEILNALITDNSYYTVDRNGKMLDVHIPPSLIGELSKDKEQFVKPIQPFKIGQIVKGSNAAKAGLLPGDEIVNVAGTPTPYFHNLQEALLKNKNKVATLQLVRQGQPKTLKVKVEENGTIGFHADILLQAETESYGFGQSLVKGTAAAFQVISLNVIGISKIFSGQIKASDSLSGPIGIANQFGGTWDWERFWHLVGLLSMVLAFMNFLPIPALDGGHVMFLTYEMVSGRKPSDKFLEVSQKVGMVILLSLMVFAFGNDIFKLLR